MKLLVSVRSLDEAAEALEGGADLIDVKEPANGAMGRAEESVIRSIVKSIDRLCPVSAAMGELRELDPTAPPAGLAFVKYGLSGLQDVHWTPIWHQVDVCATRVPVAYADASRAHSPDLENVVRFAIDNRLGVLLIDTWIKDGTKLTDLVSVYSLGHLVDRLRSNNVAVALAGSLDLDDISILAPLRPDWFAVRGAACTGGRTGRVSAERVRGLKDRIARFQPSR